MFGLPQRSQTTVSGSGTAFGRSAGGAGSDMRRIIPEALRHRSIPEALRYRSVQR